MISSFKTGVESRSPRNVTTVQIDYLHNYHKARVSLRRGIIHLIPLSNDFFATFFCKPRNFPRWQGRVNTSRPNIKCASIACVGTAKTVLAGLRMGEPA